MAFLSLARDYLIWNYSVAYVDMLHVWWNYIWFINHLFSVKDVAKSWISPFKRLSESRANIIKDPEAFFGNLFVNIIMRIVGFTIRTALMLIAVLCFTFIVVVGLWFILFWTALPLLLVHFIISGFGLLIL